VTEQEWFDCTDPHALLKRARFRDSRRKSRLFAVACCRCIWHSLLDERSRRAIEVAERHADGQAPDEELCAAARSAHAAHEEIIAAVGKGGADLEWAAAYAAHPNPFHAAKNVSWMAAASRVHVIMENGPQDWSGMRVVPCTVTKLATSGWQFTPIKEAAATGAEKPIQVALIRCIFGNPFRPVGVDPAWLAWNPGTIVKLAQAAYEERELPSGYLDRTRLAVLADALEEAGCTNTDVLDHCRQPGDHARGCWVLDLLLGKR
jgi:hypothetical protein